MAGQAGSYFRHYPQPGDGIANMQGEDNLQPHIQARVDLIVRVEYAIIGQSRKQMSELARVCKRMDMNYSAQRLQDALGEKR